MKNTNHLKSLSKQALTSLLLAVFSLQTLRADVADDRAAALTAIRNPQANTAPAGDAASGQTSTGAVANQASASTVPSQRWIGGKAIDLALSNGTSEASRISNLTQVANESIIPGTLIEADAQDKYATALHNLYEGRTAETTTALRQLLETSLSSGLLSDAHKDWIRRQMLPALAQPTNQATTTTSMHEEDSRKVSAQSTTQANTLGAGASSSVSTTTSTMQETDTRNVQSTTTIQAGADTVTQPAATATHTTLPAPLVSVDSITQALAAPTLIAKIEGLYNQMQLAQGGMFDPVTQGTFGAALVQVFNETVTVESYMVQLLNAATGTPLLNAAQQGYVQSTMLPNLDQIDDLTKPIEAAPAVASVAKDAKKHGKASPKDTAKVKGRSRRRNSRKPRKAASDNKPAADKPAADAGKDSGATAAPQATNAAGAPTATAGQPAQVDQKGKKGKRRPKKNKNKHKQTTNQPAATTSTATGTPANA